MSVSTQQQLALIMESNATRMFLSHALRMLPGIGEEDSRAPMIQMLAIGIEKLFKLTFCLIELEKTNALPSEGDLKKVGHSLLRGRDAVCERIREQDEYLKRPAAVADLKFLSEDPLLASALDALSEWGLQGRYRDLTIFVAGNVSYDDPIAKWHQCEKDLLAQDPNWTELVKTNQWETALARHEVEMIQRLIRACVRTWTLGPGGDLARTSSGIFSPWLGRMDDRLSEIAI